MPRRLKCLALAACAAAFAWPALAQEPADDPNLPPRPPAEAQDPPAEDQRAEDQPAEGEQPAQAEQPDGERQDGEQPDGDQPDGQQESQPMAVIVHDAAACPTCYPAYWTAGYLWPYPQPYPPGYTAVYAAPLSSLACPVYDWPCGYGGFVGGQAGYAPLYPYATYSHGYTGAWYPGYHGPVCLGW